MQALEEWEESCDLILQREQQLAKLEKFERLASDPNRFFEKGSRGSSLARLQESKLRGSILKVVILASVLQKMFNLFSY